MKKGVKLKSLSYQELDEYLEHLNSLANQGKGDDKEFQRVFEYWEKVT